MAAVSPPVILCDLDGTLYVGRDAIDGASGAISRLREMGCTLRFFTNTDSKTDADLLAALHGRGLDVRAGELFTPVSAALSLFTADAEANVLAIVSTSLGLAFSPISRPDLGPVTHVLVADVRDTLSYSQLDHAFRALRDGAELVALQRGRYFIAEDGPHLDTGAIVAALEYASGRGATLIGKPSSAFISLAARSAGAEPSEVWVVGDDATTDIAMGNKAGATTVQVRTGKYDDQANERQSLRPAFHEVDSIADVPDLVRHQLWR